MLKKALHLSEVLGSLDTSHRVIMTQIPRGVDTADRLMKALVLMCFFR